MNTINLSAGGALVITTLLRQMAKSIEADQRNLLALMRAVVTITILIP
jgi:hypothetical protein